MRKILIWIGIGLGALVALAVVAVIVVVFIGRSRIQGTHEVEVTMIDIPADEAVLARGEHLATALVGCVDCHGSNLAGEVFIDEPPIGRVVASNLTAGAGGVGATYSDEDWIKALRHGLRPDGRTLLPMMPSRFYAHISGEDLGALIAYLKSVPPVENELPATELAFTGNVILGVFGADSLPARAIDHTADRPAQMAPGVTADYGQYLATIGGCPECHGENLAGGRVDPSSPFGPNLTPGGAMGDWSEADFVTLMRTGVTPEGRSISPFMPWETYQNMTDEELQAIWAYLSGLPVLPTNEA